MLHPRKRSCARGFWSENIRVPNYGSQSLLQRCATGRLRCEYINSISGCIQITQIMIRFLDPLPEESIYSIIARMGARAGVPVRDIGPLVFGRTDEPAHVLIPWGVDRIITHLHPGARYTSQHLIERHSVMPILTVIQSRATGHWANTAVRRGGEGVETRNTIRNAFGTRTKPYFVYCPLCQDEQMKLYDCPYWNRLYQVPGIEVCPIHQVFLEDSPVQCWNAPNGHSYVPATCFPKKALRRVDFSREDDSLLLRVASGANWMLCNPTLSVPIASSEERFASLLREAGFNRKDGTPNLRELGRAIADRYSKNVLHSLGFTGQEVRMSRSKFPPTTRFLVSLDVLGSSAKEFLTSKPERAFAETKPFGSGPWACRNAFCEQDAKFVITSMSHWRANRGFIGEFCCPSCSMRYLRYTDQNGRVIKKCSIIEPGPIFREQLTALWKDKAITSARELGRRTHLDRNTVTLIALSFGLKPVKWRVAPYRPKAGTTVSYQRKLENYREVWCARLALHVKGSLPRLESATYRWLLKNDQTWLKEHMPIVSVTNRRRKKRRTPADDERLIQRVKRALVDLKREAPPLRRVTRRRLLSRCGIAYNLVDNKRHLLIRKFLNDNCESQLDFALRRLDQCVTDCRESSVLCSRGQLITNARITYFLRKAETKKFIEEALARALCRIGGD